MAEYIVNILNLTDNPLLFLSLGTASMIIILLIIMILLFRNMRKEKPQDNEKLEQWLVAQKDDFEKWTGTQRDDYNQWSETQREGYEQWSEAKKIEFDKWSEDEKVEFQKWSEKVKNEFVKWTETQEKFFEYIFRGQALEEFCKIRENFSGNDEEKAVENIREDILEEQTEDEVVIIKVAGEEKINIEPQSEKTKKEEHLKDVLNLKEKTEEQMHEEILERKIREQIKF